MMNRKRRPSTSGSREVRLKDVYFCYFSLKQQALGREVRCLINQHYCHIVVFPVSFDLQNQLLIEWKKNYIDISRPGRVLGILEVIQLLTHIIHGFLCSLCTFSMVPCRPEVESRPQNPENKGRSGIHFGFKRMEHIVWWITTGDDNHSGLKCHKGVTFSISSALLIAVVRKNLWLARENILRNIQLLPGNILWNDWWSLPHILHISVLDSTLFLF